MTTVSASVASSGDDGYNSNSTTIQFSLTSGTLAWLRFPNLAVPNAATINSAVLRFFQDTSKNNWASDVVVRAVAADNPGQPGTSAALTPTTTTSVAGRVSAIGSSTTFSDLTVTGPVAEVLNRPGWVAGNALLLAINGGTATSGSWSGQYILAAYDGGNSARYARMTVDYTAPVATTVNAGTAEATSTGYNSDAVVPNLFSTQTPTGTNNDDGAPGITTATTVRFTQPGYVTAVRFYATTTVSGTYTGGLWQVTHDDNPGPGAGTLLASKVRPSLPTAGGWNLITFDTPIPVTPGVLYRTGVHSSAGRYVSAPAFFGADVVNGQIIADAGGDDPVGLGTLRQGTFEINAALTYPDDTFNTSSYFIDVEFASVVDAGDTANAGVADVGVAGQDATAAVAQPAGQASVAADALTAVEGVSPQAGAAATSSDGYGATTATVASGSATAGTADVATTGQNATAAVAYSATAGQAVVGADSYSAITDTTATANPDVAHVVVAGFWATTTQDSNAVAGLAAVAADGYNPAPTVAATSGTADTTAAGLNATTATATTAAADTALVDAAAASASVSTSSSVTAAADVANVTVSADNAAQAVTINADFAAISVSATGATITTTADASAPAGAADVAVTAFNATAAPVLTVTAGTATVGVTGDNPAVSTEASTTATAGVADVSTTGYGAQIITTVTITAGTATVDTSAFGANVTAAAATDATALTAQADVQAFNALTAVLAMAGAAQVGVDAYDVPKQRRPGRFTAGIRGARLTAGTIHGPTYTTGGTP